MLCSSFWGGHLSNCCGDFQAVLVNAGCKTQGANALFPQSAGNVYLAVLVRMSKDAIRCLGMVGPGNRAPELALYRALLSSRVGHKSP